VQGLFFFLPILLGALAVLQGGLNRLISSQHGLSVAAFSNAIVIILSGSLFFGVVKYYPQFFPEFFHPSTENYKFQWWYVLPGIFGMMLVIAMPWFISKFGSAQLFIGMLAGQLIGGMLWDMVVEGIQISFKRSLAVALAVIATILMQR